MAPRIGVNHIPELSQVHSDWAIHHICYTNGDETILILSALVECSVHLYLCQVALKDLMPPLISAKSRAPVVRTRRCQEAKLGAGLSLQVHSLRSRPERFRKARSHAVSAGQQPPQSKPPILLRNDCLTTRSPFDQHSYPFGGT